MGKEVKNFFNNKIFLIAFLFLILGTVNVFAASIIINENGIRAENYYANEGSSGITQNISYKDSEGEDQTMIIINGIIVNATGGTSGEGGGSNSSFPEEGLVSYWNFDEGSGSVIDSVNGYNLTNTGATSVSGLLGSAYYFNGDENGAEDDYLRNSTAMPQIPLGSSDRTICAWTNISSATNYYYMWGYGSTSTNKMFLMYISQSNKNIVFDANGGGITSTNTLTPGSWQFVCIAQDSGTQRLYINATAQGTSTKSLDTQFTTLDFAIGINPDGTNQGFNGTIDEFGIWNRTLSVTEIEDLYNEGNGLTYS